ncbi:MAG TPA: DUF6044 family protein [Xanthobacteraceae bacterium]|nr:DUF6044 family protein [Xanthobacteraceae bacterium]
MREQSFDRNRGLFTFAVAVSGVATIENWALGSQSWIYGYGSGLETIPTFLALTYEGRNFSGWAPFVAGGVDRFAFWGNASPLSIEYLLFASLPVWLANALHRFLQYLIGIYFTARLLTDSFGQPRAWAAVAGLLFAIFSYHTVGQLFTLPGAPLLIWGLERIFERKPAWQLSIAFGFACAFLTTFSFGVPYLLVFAGSWLLIRSKITNLRTLAAFLCFALALALPNLPQAVAIAANLAESHRAEWTLEPLELSFNGLFYSQLQYDLFNQNKTLSAITQFVPWAAFAFGSAWAFFLSFRRGRACQLATYFLQIAALFFIFAQKWLWLSLQGIAVKFAPALGGIYMGRFFQIPASLLIAIGLALLLRLIWIQISSATARLVLTFVGVVAATFLILEPKRFLAVPLGIGDWGEANFKVAAVDRLRSSTTEPFRVASVLPLQPAYAYAQGLEAADGWANVFSRRYRELWLKVNEPLYRETPHLREIFGVDTGRAVDNFLLLGAGLVTADPRLRLPGEDVSLALRVGFDLDRRFRLDLLRLLNVRYLLSEYPLKGTALRLVHAPAKYPEWPLARDIYTGLVHGAYPPLPPEIAKASQLRQFWHRTLEALERKARGKDIFVYELEGAVPRVRLASKVRLVENGQALEAMVALSGESLKNEVVVELDQAEHLVGRLSFGDGRAEITAYGPDFLVSRVSTMQGAFLVIANNWNRYWRCRVNAAIRQCLRVNHTQIGMIIEPGEHLVTLTYEPPYLGWNTHALTAELSRSGE